MRHELESVIRATIYTRMRNSLIRHGYDTACLEECIYQELAAVNHAWWPDTAQPVAVVLLAEIIDLLGINLNIIASTETHTGEEFVFYALLSNGVNYAG